MKKLLAAFVALSLTSCTTLSGSGQFGSGTSVEVAQTEAEKALIVAWRAFDTLIAALETLRDAGVLQPGTERATRVADIVRTARLALDAATAAAQAGNVAEFRAALAQAEQAFVSAQAAIRSR